jgi:hypothetical protein
MRRVVWVLAVLLAGCGGSPGDLLSIGVSGGFAPAKHTIVVSADGRASCDRGPLKELPAHRVIDARELEKDVADLATRAAAYPSPAADAREYTLRTKAGTVRWGEGARGLPSELARAQLLELQLQRIVC